MKLEPVIKLDKRNKTASNELHDHVMSANCHVIVIPIYGRFGAIWKPDSGSIVFRCYIIINGDLLSYKNWKQNKKVFSTALPLLLWVKVLFLAKNAELL